MSTDSVSERPADVRIHDLAHPELPEPVLAAAKAAEQEIESIPFALDALCEEAAREIGLDDFGDDLYAAPYRLVLECVQRESGLTALGQLSVRGQIVSFLKSRLLIEDQCRKHPEILGRPVARPIVIAGLPRTGTTHLHNLVSADPALRSLPYWESLEPVAPLPEQGGADDLGARIARCETALALMNGVMPLFKRMHEMSPAYVHEEIGLLAIAGSTMFFETWAPMPTWRDHYLATDQTPFYRYLYKVLQVLQFLRGGERWVLKSPQHLEQMGPLAGTFPDATFVVTHRDPVSITASFATMIAYGARMSRDPVDPVGMGHYWSDRIERMLHACAEDRDRLPAEQSMDVRFDAFMADDVAMVQEIYALADQPFTAATRAAMDAFMAANPRGKHGRVLYDLAGFGLDRAERRRALQFYVDRFGVTLEGE